MKPTARHGPAALALLGLLVLASCGRVEPLPASDAVAHYDEVADGLTAAIGGEDAEWTFNVRPQHVTLEDGDCTYTAGRWDLEEPLEHPGPESDEWRTRIAAVNPVLEDHGFERIAKPTQQGAGTLLQSTDEHGATATISGNGDLYIHSAVVDAETCTPEALGIV